jgi:hypothetical protein
VVKNAASTVCARCATLDMLGPNWPKFDATPTSNFSAFSASELNVSEQVRSPPCPPMLQSATQQWSSPDPHVALLHML